MELIPREINRRLGRAMHDYSMLADGDHVLVAVSGGIDSLVLATILTSWRRKAPIDYSLTAFHIDMHFDPADCPHITKQLKNLDIPVHTVKTGDHPGDGNQVLDCFLCARQRRNRLFAFAKEKGCNKLALGHHRDDIIETFFMNLFYSGNISTMVPRQELFEGRLSIIRPMAYLEKKEIIELGTIFGTVPSTGECPFSAGSRRTHVRRLLEDLYGGDQQIKANIFAALANVKQEYLLRKP